MQTSMRRFATVNHGTKLRGKGAPLSLEHFVQRQKVISLWRDCMRTVYQIQPSDTRDEMRIYARQEFERYRKISDLGHIRYLCSTGKTQLDSMKRLVIQQSR